MKVKRFGINLTSLTDAQLSAIVTGLNAPEWEMNFCRESFSGMRIRPAVLEAVAAIDATNIVRTVTTHIEPSYESKLWSNMEGGHTFHQEPDLTDEIAKLIHQEAR